MSSARSTGISSSAPPESGGQAQPSREAKRERTPKSRAKLLVAIALIAVILVLGVAYASELHSPTSRKPSYSSTFYSASPSAIISAAVNQNQAGYVLESEKAGVVDGGVEGGDWALLGNSQDGSSANLTVLEFSSTNASQEYYRDYVTSVEGLSNYTDSSSALSSFQQYGGCYAYGEDVEGIAVLNGICADGNLALRIHMASAASYQQLEGEMASLMASLYDAAAES